MTFSQGQINASRHRGSRLQMITCADSGRAEGMARRLAGFIGDRAAPFSIIPFTCTKRAYDILFRHAFGLARAFAAALSKSRKADLLAGDPGLKVLEKAIRISWFVG